MPDWLMSWLDPQWISSQVSGDSLGSFVAWTILMLAAGFAVGRLWRNRAHEAKMARAVAEREDEIRGYRAQVSTLTRQIEVSTEVMKKSSETMLQGVEVGKAAQEHISSQDAQLEHFYDTILNMKALIDKMNDIITALTKDRMAMLSDTERESLWKAYESDSPCEIGDEDVAEHLVTLGALDRLSSGRYAVSGEWRRSMSAMPERWR